jgi:hypothetical protein
LVPSERETGFWVAPMSTQNRTQQAGCYTTDPICLSTSPCSALVWTGTARRPPRARLQWWSRCGLWRCSAGRQEMMYTWIKVTHD